MRIATPRGVEGPPPCRREHLPAPRGVHFCVAYPCTSLRGPTLTQQPRRANKGTHTHKVRCPPMRVHSKGSAVCRVGLGVPALAGSVLPPRQPLRVLHAPDAPGCLAPRTARGLRPSPRGVVACLAFAPSPGSFCGRKCPLALGCSLKPRLSLLPSDERPLPHLPGPGHGHHPAAEHRRV